MSAHVLACSVPGAYAPPVIRGLAAWKLYLSFFRDQVGALATFQQRHGALASFRDPFSRHRRGFVISGAELNRQVLGNPEMFHSGSLTISGRRDSVLNRLRRGMIGSNGQAHRDIRRLVSPLFMPKAVQRYVPRMVEVVREQLDTWPVGGTYDVDAHVSRVALRVAAENLIAGENPEDMLQLAEMSAGVLKQSFALSVRMLCLNVAGTPFRRLVNNAEKLERLLLDLVDRREPCTQDSPNLLDRLISFHRAEPERLSREDLIGQVFILFAASHETVTKAVTWSLFLLAQHPRIMAGVHDELRCQCDSEPPTMADLEQMPLLDAATKEAMRLLPPVPLSRRVASAEGELGGLSVHPGDFAILNHYATHRDPDVFPEPARFLPERWFSAMPDRFAYLPFSAGPRTCIGKVLGTTTINLMVAMILQRFRLTMQPHCRIDRSYHITLAPKFGLPMSVEPQDGRFQAVPIRGNVHEMVDLSRSEDQARVRYRPRPVALKSAA